MAECVLNRRFSLAEYQVQVVERMLNTEFSLAESNLNMESSLPEHQVQVAERILNTEPG